LVYQKMQLFYCYFLSSYTLMWKVQNSSLTHSIYRLQDLFHCSYWSILWTAQGIRTLNLLFWCIWN
jgi:hypothetical protein